ncbi:hypothetical protein E6O75_ATG07419 [Venturia nashicola]|uniref:Uncharacterized protein n=1 Tax=Venturia nashicola TaxID=86259 RepID=A0A4Z1NXN4_9PEZI|nr:hypothetical protein E6O75_ATG07419 [Venturia nashicola]
MARPKKRVKREHVFAEPTPPCQFLELPIEVRLLIYDYAIAETNHITISVAEVEKNIFDDSTPKETVEGIPGQFIPLVKHGFDPKMMEIGKVDMIPLPDILGTRTLITSMDSGYGSFDAFNSTGGGKLGSPNHPELPLLTAMSLFLTNRQIHQEMTAHVKHPTSERSTLHVNYPYGIIVLETLYPSLLRYAEKICISGWYERTGDDEESSNGFGPCLTQGVNRPSIPLTHIPSSVYELANSSLARLIRTTLPKNLHPTLKSLSFRIFYPRESEYSVIWSCNQSPIPVALKNMCGGKVGMKVLRGGLGNGVVMDVEPMVEKRCLTTVWRRFQGGRTGEAEAWRSFGDERTWRRDCPPVEGGTWTTC